MLTFILSFLQSVVDTDILSEFQALMSDKLMFLDSEVFDAENLTLLLVRFVFNILICWIIIQFFYYKKSRRKDYYFTFMLFGVSIFFILFILQNLSISVGFALGLFGIFGMIRYRTETVQIREMTYLFIIIAISVVNGLSREVPWVSLIVANLLVVGVIWILESNHFLKHTSNKIVLYEKIGLIVPEKRAELIADLKVRTGLDITKVEVGHIDFLRDVAFIKVYYKGDPSQINTIDNVTRFS